MMHNLLRAATAASILAAAAPAAPAAPSRALDSLKSIIERTAAVVEGDVSAIRYEYDDRLGPRTLVTLGDPRVRLGSAPAGPLKLQPMSGPLPDGRFLMIPELPRFAASGRYLVFLDNGAWFYSPVVGALALRVEVVDGAELLINQEGFAVTGIGRDGLSFEGPQLFEPVRELTRPFDAPVALERDGAPRGLSVAAFVAAMSAFAAREGVKFGGAFSAVPDPERTWRKVTGQPAGEER
jgi:hypothetical protein